MNELDLFDELTFIDDDLILEAQETPVRPPIRFRGLGRVAVLVAAVLMMLAVTVGAKEWILSTHLLAETYGTEPDHSYFWVESGIRYEVENSSFYVDDREVRYILSEAYKPEELQLYFTCEGETLKVTLEAMLLMEDGRTEYKQIESTGKNCLSLLMDNYVDSEAGSIFMVRTKIYYQFHEEWECIWERYCPLYYRLGLELPYGTDLRFPDMQFNYDGRGE